MSYNGCSSVAFVKGHKYTLRVETFARKKITQFKVCKKYQTFCERKTFYIYHMKKLVNDKTRIEMAKLMKVSALRQAPDL